MTKRNFLLGRGERLTSTVIVKTGPPTKVPPYTFSEARERLTPMIKGAAEKFDSLPTSACPDGKVVGALTLNPEYIAKSYYPSELLKAVGLEALGSRPLLVTPNKRSKDRPPEEALTTQLFVLGARSAFHSWANGLSDWNEHTRVATDLVAIESVDAPTALGKIKGNLPSQGTVIFEVILHTDEILGEVKTLPLFKAYLSSLGIDATLDRRFYAGGLCFLQIEAPASYAERIATYTIVRALRQMPQLRVLRPTIRASSMPTQTLVLPTASAIDPQIKAAIFDGGLPTNHPITRWATAIDGTGVSTAHAEYLEHGLGVTSAFLFGHLDPTKPIPIPYCPVDHYRVLDAAPGQDPRELYEVLERIQTVLTQKRYQLVNLSLGPILPVDDDEVHAWTAVLDELFANGNTLATIAVGNTGESDQAAGLNRIQVPADCVNALAIGASDSPDANWQRAPYSSVGPGRSPGLMKPDVLEFGGSVQRPFLVLGPNQIPSLHPTGGTSFSAPSALRLGAGVRAHFGDAMDMLAIRALLVHCTETSDLPMNEIGRGRVARDLETLVVCGDDTIRVVYQGDISPAKYIRAPIPLPLATLAGKVLVTATLCYVTNVDPHHPGNYTRAGLEVAFRPNDEKRKTDEQIHADTKSFFGKGQKGLTEEELRRDAWKWENCLHASVSFLGQSLKNPAFDIHYNSRLEGHGHNPSQKLRYALVISVRAPRVIDLYDQVVRRFATQLEPLRPVIDIPIRV
jgi:Subtilase family